MMCSGHPGLLLCFFPASAVVKAEKLAMQALAVFVAYSCIEYGSHKLVAAPVFNLPQQK